MTRIDTNRTHSSNLTAQSAAHAARWGAKGYANVNTAIRALNRKGLLERIEADGLAPHFAFVTITEGEHAGRVIPTLGFEYGCEISPVAFNYTADLQLISAL